MSAIPSVFALIAEQLGDLCLPWGQFSTYRTSPVLSNHRENANTLSYFLERIQYINSLAPGGVEGNIIQAIFKWTLVIDGLGIPCEIALG